MIPAVPAILSYDRAKNIVFMHFAVAEELQTKKEIGDHFARVIEFWRAEATGKKAYFVVDLENITINPQELEFYAEESKRAHALCALVSVRYGGNPIQRTLTRLAGMKIHRPSNIYETKEEAMEVVRALASGQIKARTT
jgi:hypothetical protein